MSTKLKVHLSLWLVTLIYAATFSIAKQVMPMYIKPFGFILIRVIVATIGLIVFHRIFIKEKIHDKRDYIKLFVCAVFGVAANMLLFFKGLSITTPINAAVLMMYTPIFVVLFAAIWLKEKVTIQKVVGVLLATFGAVLLIGGRNFNFSSTGVWGDIMVALNAIIYAFFLVYAKSLIQKYHPLTVTLYTFLFGLFIVIPFGFNEFSEIDFIAFPKIIWVYILFITVGSTFVTYVLSSYALKHASSSLVGTYIYLQPVLATLIAIVFGTDLLTLEKLIFICIIFVGVYFASFKKK